MTNELVQDQGKKKQSLFDSGVRFRFSLQTLMLFVFGFSGVVLICLECVRQYRHTQDALDIIAIVVDEHVLRNEGMWPENWECLPTGEIQVDGRYFSWPEDSETIRQYVTIEDSICDGEVAEWGKDRVPAIHGTGIWSFLVVVSKKLYGNLYGFSRARLERNPNIVSQIEASLALVEQTGHLPGDFCFVYSDVVSRETLRIDHLGLLTWHRPLINSKNEQVQLDAKQIQAIAGILRVVKPWMQTDAVRESYPDETRVAIQLTINAQESKAFEWFNSLRYNQKAYRVVSSIDHLISGRPSSP